MTVRTPGAIGREDLRALFEKSPAAAEKIGLEIENGVVDPETGKGAPYAGANGIGALMRAIIADFGGTPIIEGEHVTGMQHDSGMQLTLEHGGALEYASAPQDDLVTAVEDMRAVLSRAAELARDLGLAILPGASLPFDRIDDAPWVAKPRGAIMREYFGRIGDAGAWGPTVMALTLSTQVTLDYRDEADLAEKLRVQVAASTVAAGMFANSPFEGGELTGLLSRRTQCWQKTDPRRCGVLPSALADRMRIDDFIDWAIQLPMIYHRDRDGRYRPAPDRPFGTLLDEGFGDGSRPAWEDWVSHLSQIWTDVRLRDTLELRAADGPAYPDIPAVPAFWVGLIYHPESRAAAGELLRGYTLDQHRETMREIPALGLDAKLGCDSVHELGRELVRLAEAGLTARVAGGLEGAPALSYLDPLKDVLESGETFAQRCIRRWDGDLNRSPARYVQAYRI